MKSKTKKTATKYSGFVKFADDAYESLDGRVEINMLPDGCWAWAVDGVGYDAEGTLEGAMLAAENYISNEG